MNFIYSGFEQAKELLYEAFIQICFFYDCLLLTGSHSWR